MNLIKMGNILEQKKKEKWEIVKGGKMIYRISLEDIREQIEDVLNTW